MGEYIVRSHQLSLVDGAMDGQHPHTTHVRGTVIELDDDHYHTAELVRTGAVQSKKAAEQAEKAEASSHQLESQVGKHEATSGRSTKG